jgi:WD40 repeat protein
VATLEGHTFAIFTLRLSEDGNTLYSGSGDGTIKVWDTASNTCIATLQGHADYVTSLCLYVETNSLIFLSDQKAIKVLDLASNTRTDTIIDAHRDRIYSVALSDSSDILYSTGEQTMKIKDGALDDYAITAWRLIHSWA